MKKAIILSSIILSAVVVLALKSNEEQDLPATYATIAYSTATSSIYLYFGGDKKEEIEIKKHENPNQLILDAINRLSAQGYDVVTSNTHAFNVNFNHEQTFTSATGNYIEFYYTLRKGAPNSRN